MRCWSRRSILRAGGLALALPPLEALVAPHAAHGAGAGPDVLVAFHFPDGVYLSDWMALPSSPGGPWPDQLQPLAAHRDRLTVLTGLSNIAAGEGCQTGGSPHGTPRIALFTGNATTCDGAPGNASFDVVASQTLPPTTRPLLGLRPYKGHTFSADMSFSAAGVGTGIAPLMRPSVVFDQLFAAGLDPAQAEAIRARRQSILDFAGAELDDLRGDLGAADRVRLDLYGDALRELELRVTAAVGECTPPAMPPADDTDNIPYDQIPARTELLMDLGVLALRCGITRVLTFSVGPSQNPVLYPFLPMGATPSSDVHQLSHMSWTEDGELAAHWYRDMVKYHLSMFARLLDGLLVDGDLGEDLLARSIVVCASEFSQGGIHHPYNLPVVLGGAGLPGNRVIHYDCAITNPATPQWDDPKYIEHCHDAAATPIANLWLTILRALGSNVESFGESTGTLDGLW